MVKQNLFTEKMTESVRSILPIFLIVAAVCFFVVPIDSSLMLSFVIGSVMVTVGMGLFNLGSESSMTEIGNLIGSKITKSRNLFLIITVSFIIGVAITVAEPDLQVLASSAPNIDSFVLVATVSAGVGLFLLLSMLRILFAFSLKWILVGFYGAIIILSFFVDKNFLSVAFDAGGVTTGPMTVPFIMALGVGVASIRSDSNAKDDSFGLVGLCSIGPVIAVMILSFIYSGSLPENIGADYAETFDTTVDMGFGYIASIPEYLGEVAFALLPIFAFFLIFQIFSLRLKKRGFLEIMVGIIYTYAGLVLFLTGVNVGFSPLGFVLGGALHSEGMTFFAVPLAMVMGWFIINAEPAVHVLNRQVTELSAGAISEKAMKLSLSVGIAAAMGLSMVRVITGVPILWFTVAGYTVALALSFFVPKNFTAIAFDSGGVASGPLTATFMLPFAMGLSDALGGNVAADAFGLVALVAMMPLITVQVMGAVSVIKKSRFAPSGTEEAVPESESVIELWEAA